MHSRGIIGAVLAAALSIPTVAAAQEHAAAPAYPPGTVPAYPAGTVPVYPAGTVPAYPTVVYPDTPEGNYQAARAHKQLYRHHKREYRRQRRLLRHGIVVVGAPMLPVPIVAPVAVVAPVYAPVPVPVVIPQQAPAAPPPAVQKQAPQDDGRAILGADVQAHPDGASVGASLQAEGKRFGVHLAANGILARADDGSSRLETLKLVEAHLTFAPISGSRGRVRAELGASAAFAPCLNTVGPDVGLSGDLRVLGPFGVEAAARYAPFPHKRAEASAGVFLALGALRLDAGWRSRWLDARVLEGMDTVENLRGPYLGASLVF